MRRGPGRQVLGPVWAQYRLGLPTWPTWCVPGATFPEATVRDSNRGPEVALLNSSSLVVTPSPLSDQIVGRTLGRRGLLCGLEAS
jgi:hypothetical protein